MSIWTSLSSCYSATFLRGLELEFRLRDLQQIKMSQLTVARPTSPIHLILCPSIRQLRPPGQNTR